MATRHTGECRPVDEVEQWLDPAPVNVQEVLKRFLQLVNAIAPTLRAGARSREGIIQVWLRVPLVPFVARHW